MRWRSSGCWLAAVGWLLGAGCGPLDSGPLERHFYHWETTLAPDSLDRELLAPLGDAPLFVRVFDVVWEDSRPYPTAQLELGDTTGLPPVVPVVFITNEVMRNQPADALETLVRDIAVTTDDLLAGLDRHPEIQFDCDWTAGTRDRYFAFLRAARKYFPNISVTVRLHQYRDRAAQGVPPADRGVLMAYNTGELDDWTTENSIVDTNVIRSYLHDQPAYPIPLDIAVAVYDWAAVYRQGRLAYLLNEPPLPELADTTFFRPLAPNRFEVVTPTYYDGLYLYRGDLLRRETAPPADYERTAALVRREIGAAAGQRLLVYRLGSRLWGH